MINKINKNKTFKLKTEYYLKLLTPEIMKLLGSTENKRIKDGKNGKNVPHFEITEVVLAHCIVSDDYQQDSRVSHMCSK